MDRQTVSQVVAMLVVLAALVRWIPGDDPDDVLGRGDPWHALWLDRHLVELGEQDPDAPQAYLRGLRRLDTDSFFRYWHRRLREVRKIHEEADEDTFIQFKGVPRNEQWQMVYDLYPLRTTGDYHEAGGSEDDPDLPGATVVRSYLIRKEDMTPEERRRMKQASQDKQSDTWR